MAKNKEQPNVVAEDAEQSDVTIDEATQPDVDKTWVKPASPWDEKIPITTPRLAGSKEQPDIIASVNGRVFSIKRGVTVEVPKPIYEVLERSFKAEMQAEIDYYNKAQINEV